MEYSRTAIVITGPTASGKTAAAVELSKFLPIEVISADSRQIYRYLDIGTAKPTSEELKAVRHHFIDILYPDEYYSAGLFEKQAGLVLNDIFLRNKIPVIVGGSGLYIKALCEGFFDEESVDKNQKEIIRKQLENRLANEGIDSLYSELLKIDSYSAMIYSDKNPRRIIRALEFFELYGSTISNAHKEYQAKKDFKAVYYGIYFDRENLYKRINLRAEWMWNNGLVDEVKDILKIGYKKELNSLNTVGYKEAIGYLDSLLNSEMALNEIQKNTRRYAKRQMTWFNKIDSIRWLDAKSDVAGIIAQDFKNNIV
ncbi:MAG: tRNA dimethylallyltransferase [Bacteroidota bacterium]|nr:tRNA dimethylallyltransferase [Bacteroidota bacterium]